MSTVLKNEPTSVPKNERATLAQIEQLLAKGGVSEPVKLLGADGTQVLVPPSLLLQLRILVHDLAQDRPVTLVSTSRELTTQEAADLLNVSRPFLVKQLLETGQLPYIMTGSHRRIAFDDVMAYRQRRDAERRRTLRDLSQLSQQLGLK